MKTVLIAAIIAMLWTGGPARADLYETYGAVLKKHVDDHGLVDYAGLKADRADLDAFMRVIAGTDPLEYARWSDNDKLAYWINAYNAYILTMVIDNYPIERALGHERYPDGSVQQLPSPWKRGRYTVMREKRAPDAIEHEIIRVAFKEPRIHYALVCGAVSCPPLRGEPYRGDVLDRQLDEQAQRFFSDLRNFQADREKNDLYVSSIFDWFSEDFAPGVLEKEGAFAAQRQAVVNAAHSFVDAGARAYLDQGDFTLKYFDYDWHLNGQAK